MELIAVISGVIGALVAVLSFFGIGFGRKRLMGNLTLFGEKAVQRLEFLEKNTLKGYMPEEYPYRGGNLRIPQLKVEKLNYDPQTMPKNWNKYTRIFQYFDKNEKNPDGIWVKEWLI